MTDKVRDLRSALRRLESMPGQLITTKEGPAMIFENVKGHPGAKVAIGLLASRKRVAALLDTQPEDLGKLLCRCAENPVQPVVTDKKPLCQEVVHLAEDPEKWL